MRTYVFFVISKFTRTGFTFLILQYRRKKLVPYTNILSYMFSPPHSEHFQPFCSLSYCELVLRLIDAVFHSTIASHVPTSRTFPQVADWLSQQYVSLDDKKLSHKLAEVFFSVFGELHPDLFVHTDTPTHTDTLIHNMSMLPSVTHRNALRPILLISFVSVQAGVHRQTFPSL